MKNRLILVLVLCAVAVPLAFTEAQTIFIGTIEQLQAIGTDVDKPLNGDYELSNNIDASITANWNSGAGFMPIGNEATPFVGTFNGAGYEITNLYINRATIEGVGLFGRLSAPAVIENLTISGANITGAARSGIIAGGGQATFGSAILRRNCKTTGEVKSITGDDTGGIAGFFINGSISDCHSTAKVIGRYNVGGIAGRLESAQTYLLRSFATGDVSGVGRVGGLVGLSKSASIEDCYATGLIQGSSVWGNPPPPSGGIVGKIENGSVSRCYFAGDVERLGDAGAFCGNNTGTIADSFYCIDNITDEALKTIGVKEGSSAGVEGKTAEQLSQIATYANWNIALQENHQQEVWWIKQSNTFARLRYESLGASISLASPSDLQALRSSKVVFSANITAGELTITDVVLNVGGVEYATGDLSESGEYYWQREIRGIAEGQHWWQLTVYADFNSEQVITTSAVRNFEVDYSLPPQPIYYTPQPVPAMVIIDDDGAQGVYTKLLPVAQEYDIPLSPAILIKYDASQPQIPPVIPEWGWASMTIAQVVEMSQAGHSIISHGTMHTSHGQINSVNSFTSGSLILDGGNNFNGRFSHLHAITNVERGLFGIEVDIWEEADEAIRETIYIVSGGRSSRYDSSNPNSPNAWDIEPITISSPLVNSYNQPIVEMTVAETERICLEVHNGFAAAGLPVPRHYVFPFNETPSSPQLNKMFEYFDTLHQDHGLKVYPAPLRETGNKPFLLTRELLDEVADPSVIDGIIDKILDYKGLGFVYVHADYGDPPLYEYLVNAAAEKGLRIIGFSEAWAEYRYRLTNIYPALNQEVDFEGGTVELSLEVIEATESDSIEVLFWNVSNSQQPLLIDTVSISSGQTATANFSIEQNNQYKWAAEIFVLTQAGEVSNWTTDTFLFNTIQNPIGDINSDGIVDELDLSLLTSNWLLELPPGQVLRSDFNDDRFINLLDYSVIASNWLEEK